MSADVGVLDEVALAARLADDPDEAVALLADLARATDRELRRQARALAPRLLVPMARYGLGPATSGAVKLVRSRRPGLDLDIDATIEEIAGLVPARGAPSGRSPAPGGPSPMLSGRPPAPAGDDLRWRRWERPGQAHILLVDASGSVAGRPLATALVTAAALAGRFRPGDELAVVAFWSRAVVLRPITSAAPPLAVLDALFDLAGGDTTDLAAGLRAALAQAGRAGVGQREVLVLTDGVVTAGDDPLPVAASAAGAGATVHVLGLSDEPESLAAGRAIADAGGGRFALLLRPSDAPLAIATVLGPT